METNEGVASFKSQAGQVGREGHQAIPCLSIVTEVIVTAHRLADFREPSRQHATNSGGAIFLDLQKSEIGGGLWTTLSDARII